MRKVLILILFFLLGCKNVFALEIVYPKTNPVKINASSTFFIGSVNQGTNLKVNDIEVKVSPLGAFAKIVPLNFGINKFKLISDKDVINFVIERPQPSAADAHVSQLIEYPANISNFYVKNDNAPLRLTPIDSGINRLSHLSKNMQLRINGEKGDFYRVCLNSQLFGWIAKSDVEQKIDINNDCKPILIRSFKIKEDNDFFIYEFDLSGKTTPFIIKENNGLTLQLFNLQGLEDYTLTYNIPVQKLFGYDAYYDKDNKFVLKIRKFPLIDTEKPLKNIRIAVDAGHGGSEFGAIGCCGDKEKDINLAISKELQKELEKRGAKVIMTRENDSDLSIKDRVKIVKENNAALSVSIHANALPDGADPIKNRGTSVYYYHNQAKPLAECVLNSMTTQLGTQNDKVRQASLALVRPTFSLSILIEVAYIINPDDYALLLDKDFQAKCAKSIADGIEKYIIQFN